jgi:hypothetical protein
MLAFKGFFVSSYYVNYYDGEVKIFEEAYKQ